jgi:hypothetical protein
MYRRTRNLNRAENSETMNFQVLFFAVTILTAINSYPKALADFVASFPVTPESRAWPYTYAASSWARLQLLGQHNSSSANATNSTQHNSSATNVTNSNKASCPSPLLTDQDLAGELEGLVVPMIIVLILAVLTIVVCEGLAFKQRRVLQRAPEVTEEGVALQER